MFLEFPTGAFLRGQLRFYLACVSFALAGPALAGPPYVTDDPEPTDTGHFENYLYTEGAKASGSFSGPAAGIEINYGVLPDTQLTAGVPLNPNPGPSGMGEVWVPFELGVKYRFIGEDDDGWRPQVAFFPQLQLPVGSAARSEPTTELLPIWAQKTIGAWTTFGGGGLTINHGAGSRDYAIYGWALQRQLTPNFAFGAEIFGQTRSAVEAGAATAVGLDAIYDLSENWHLVGSVNTGIVDRQDSDQISYNFALKWTI